MKKILLFIAPLIILSCNGQDKPKELIEIQNYSSYNNIGLKEHQEIGPATKSYYKIIQDVMSLIGIPNSDIEIRTTPSFGAFSVINRDCRRRFFLYNEVFFDSVYALTKSYEPIKSICFHEIAHHFYRHPLKSRWEAHLHELEADRYSGFQMRLIGATLEESIAAMKYFGNETTSQSHPEKSIRINEIKAGYIDASLRVFKDSTLIKEDSLIKKNELLFSFKEVQKQNKAFEKANKEIFKDDSELNVENIIPQTAYCILGKILIVNAKNEVFDLATNERVGRITSPYPNAGFELLKFETSTYKIENGNIYSMNQLGIPIKLGTKIN